MKDACNWDDAHSTSSKVHRLRSLHIVHIKHRGIRFHISEFGPQHHHTHGKSKPSPVKPTKPQTSWYTAPQLESQATINQEVIHSLPATMAHTTPTHHWITSLDEILKSENFPPSHCPHKERNSLRGLRPPYGLPRKRQRAWAPQYLIKRLQSELPGTL